MCLKDALRALCGPAQQVSLDVSTDQDSSHKPLRKRSRESESNGSKPANSTAWIWAGRWNPWVDPVRRAIAVEPEFGRLLQGKKTTPMVRVGSEMWL